jgi:hypothetical protein
MADKHSLGDVRRAYLMLATETQPLYGLSGS